MLLPRIIIPEFVQFACALGDTGRRSFHVDEVSAVITLLKYLADTGDGVMRLVQIYCENAIGVKARPHPGPEARRFFFFRSGKP
jgi:hypothetical protein